MGNEPRETIVGLTRRRLRLASGIVAVIAAASLLGHQALGLLPKGVLAPVIAGLGVILLTLAAKAARPERLRLAALFLSSVALIALLSVHAGLLTVAELTHVAFFGGLGFALGPARPPYAIAALTMVSAGDEALQALLPYRIGSLADVGLNLVSALVFYGGWRTFGQRTSPTSRH
jgi:hypothetical protein